MKMLYIIVFSILSSFGVESQTNLSSPSVDDRYDPFESQINCYSRVDKSRVVKCNGICVQKSIISRYKINGEYTIDSYHRLGCESRTFDKTLHKFLCSADFSNTTSYSVDYMLSGDNIRNPRLWIRKTCCFYSKCNKPEMHAYRYWFRANRSMLSLLRTKLERPHVLGFAVFCLVLGLMLYAFVCYLISWFKSKKLAEGGAQNCRELEQDVMKESEFVESTIVETDIEVTGRLDIQETAYLLSMLPELDKLKYSKTKSMSASEDSARDTKRPELMVVVPVRSAEPDKKIRKVTIKPPLKTRATGWGHVLWNTARTINSPYDLLYRMIEHGPYQYPFAALELLALFEETAFKMADEPSLLQIEADITVIGDIRGRYVDLHRWLQLTGWPPKNRILFLGGILDNDEPGSLECLALICSLKCRFPKHVFLLRGEPEMSPFRMSHRLHPVITRAVQSCIKRMCSQMPFAAIIGKSVLAVYSGFSPMIREKEHIKSLFRPVTSENLNPVERHIIYNQPSNKVRMYRPNTKGEGDWFGKQAVKRACKAMKCNTMIRGQSYVPFGYLPCWNNRLLTVWSAPGYGSNYGAVLWISKELVITPILMEKQPT